MKDAFTREQMRVLLNEFDERYGHIYCATLETACEMLMKPDEEDPEDKTMAQIDAFVEILLDRFMHEGFKTNLILDEYFPNEKGEDDDSEDHIHP